MINAGGAHGTPRRRTGAGRGGGRAQARQQQHIEQVQAGEEQARHQGLLVHAEDGYAGGVGDHDQHQAGRDQLRQRARRGDAAGRQARGVARAQHGRQCDQAHRDDAGLHHAGGRCQHRAHDDDRHRQPAARALQQRRHGCQHLLGDAAAFEHQPHQREERDGEQHLAEEQAVHPQHVGLRHRQRKEVQRRAQQREGEAVHDEGQADREAQQQGRRHADEHQRCHAVVHADDA
jgi:hypothetical protein